ncbi:class C sortase [Granulicatella seriolae]|uniref:Class C sortase n=1 Tax=Granulicatella seriolae TaxID=2967226 RepID=A0ABT1WNW5_9LACT|nr:class C sortase [Granulicatella seriolae]
MQQRSSNKRVYRMGLITILVGLLVILYPLQSITWNHFTSKDELKTFLQDEQKMTDQVKQRLEEQAKTYNSSIDPNAVGVVDPFEVKDFTTATILSMEPDAAFAFVSIPKIDETLPIYQGASDYHLSLGAAHVTGTSLPIGGMGQRSVIAGHRGYATQRMFQYLDRLEPGDKIYITILGKVLTYEVYDSQVIWPSESGKLAAVDGEDVLTLLTCTPYLVNTERLLVNARRVDEVSSTTGQVSQTPEDQVAQVSQGTVDQGVEFRIRLFQILVLVLWLAVALVFIKLLVSFRHKKIGE